jgi:hypothetical protein
VIRCIGLNEGEDIIESFWLPVDSGAPGVGAYDDGAYVRVTVLILIKRLVGPMAKGAVRQFPAGSIANMANINNREGINTPLMVDFYIG